MIASAEPAIARSPIVANRANVVWRDNAPRFQRRIERTVSVRQKAARTAKGVDDAWTVRATAATLKQLQPTSQNKPPDRLLGMVLQCHGKACLVSDKERVSMLTRSGFVRCGGAKLTQPAT